MGALRRLFDPTAPPGSRPRWPPFTLGFGGNEAESPSACSTCQGSRVVPCHNCDDASGFYVSYGQRVKCKGCRGSGRVICRACFDSLGIEPGDLGAVGTYMGRLPD